MPIRFTATLNLNGKTATGIVVPPEVVADLGSSKKPAVKVTFNNHTYRTSIASMGGKYLIPVSAEIRAASGATAGDVLDIAVELDNEPREVTVPDDLSAALDASPDARHYFDALSYSNKLRHVLSINEAKSPETRERRIAKSVGMFREGRN